MSPAAAILLAAAAASRVWGSDTSRDGSRPQRGPARMLETVRDVASVVRGCWQVPEGLRRLERIEVTVRFSLKADGSLLGQRRVSFATLPPDTRARDLLARSALDAVAACTPLRLSPALGRAIAGRPFAIRFTYRGPAGQGA